MKTTRDGRRLCGPALLVAALTVGSVAAEEPANRSASALLNALDPDVQILAAEVLERHPGVARGRSLAAAAEARVPQAAALPDPTAAFNLFVLPPETRVGPQRLSVMVSQRLPWFGKLERRERAAFFEAAAARADLEGERLRVLTEARRVLYELAFQEAYAEINRQELQHLVRHEEVALARYGAGAGLQQQVIRVQAEITRRQQRELQIRTRQAQLTAAFNRLRDRPATTPIEIPQLPRSRSLELDVERLRALARQRPEALAASARAAAGEARVEHAEKGFKPDFQLGLSFTLVDRRDDDVGRVNPPQGNGDDIFALTAGANIPLRRPRLEAALGEALHRQSAAEESHRAVLAEIEYQIGDLVARLPLLEQQWRLLDQVLMTQAEEAWRSAEAAYATGKLSALDLLDAEHVLFDVRTSRARTQADWAIAWVRLEGTVGASISLNPLSPNLEDAP